MIITLPALTDRPDAPESTKCREVEVSRDVLNPLRGGDPAALTDLEMAVLVDAAVDHVARWHRIAESSDIPTPAWEQLLLADSHSGHKLHIGCATLADVRTALGAVFAACFRAALGCKVATTADILAHTGKGVVIYLPHRATVDRDASLVAQALAGYAPAQPVEIASSRRLARDLWWRHEFGGVDPGYDVYSPSEYRALYVRAKKSLMK